MKNMLGIDLGTSSVKAVVVNEEGLPLGIGMQEYPIEIPKPEWAEQSPEVWWDSTVVAVQQAVRQARVSINAIGLSGQMHGLVLIGFDNRPVAPAIIWADQRSTREVEDMISLVGTNRLAAVAGTAPACGFMGPSLLWLKRHEPKRLERSLACLLPKDYIRLCLTGEVATEATDASSTALFDISRRLWSKEIIEALGLPDRIFPPVLRSSDVAGSLLKQAADELSLPAGIPVVAGCADQVAQAIGNGLVDPGEASITIGSGGQIFIPLEKPITDDQLRIHCFCHAPVDRWYLLGAMLTAGLSLHWFRDLLELKQDDQAYSKLAGLAAKVQPGAGGLLFLPYLAGERSPVMDPKARGCFVGLALHHDRGYLARAILEGVAFAIRQILETTTALNVPIQRLLAAGKGLSSPIWRQILADILGRPLQRHSEAERTAIGAALVAGLGVNIYGSYSELKEIIRPATEITEPSRENLGLYEQRYGMYREIYPKMRDLFRPD